MASTRYSWGSMLVFAVVLGSGCIKATFYSKTGRSYPKISSRAVIVTAEESALVAAAGGYEIGRVEAGVREDMARGQEFGVDDLTEKAAKVASDRGGTHLIVTGTGTNTITYERPETISRSCERDEDSSSCETTYRPPAEWTEQRPTASYVVLRVPRERWSLLPEDLRPDSD